MTTIKDHTPEYKRELARAIERSLEAVGLFVEGAAEELCPIDTGRLVNSITHETDAGNKLVQIGTDVRYAKHVELGTIKQKAKPYLRPAVKENIPQIRRIIKKELSR